LAGVSQTIPAGTDRRHLRRQQTIDEIIEVAVRLMADNGVAGLSLGEVARQMGMRTPSLYGYFPSKNALYDAVFARGAQSVLDAVGTPDELVREAASAYDALLLAGRAMARWCMANQVYAQLLFWRTVPDFTPSPGAYAPAIELVGRTRALLASLRDRGLLRADADIDAAVRDWTVLISGVLSQQLANAPEEDAETGRFTAALPGLTRMFTREYGPGPAR
jgi:AcrR family transcriptional regulator